MRYVEVLVSEYDESVVEMLRKSAALSSRLATSMNKKRRTTSYECDIDVAHGQMVVVPWGDAYRVGIIKSDSDMAKIDDLKKRGVVFKQVQYAIFNPSEEAPAS